MASVCRFNKLNIIVFVHNSLAVCFPLFRLGPANDKKIDLHPPLPNHKMKLSKNIQLLLLLVLFYGSTSLAQIQEGKASYYADKFEGSPTASGEKYRHNKLTAAHKTLPFGTKVKVTNLANGKEVEVVINDRGPFVEGRVIDLSKSAAEQLDFINQGLADVRIIVVDPGDGKGRTVVQPIDQVRVEENELYEFEVTRVMALGYGVQIGSYQELANLVRFCENLKTSYRKKVTVQVKVINGIKVYTVIVGQFPSREKAEEFRTEVNPRFPDAFIIDFANLK